MSLPEEGGYFLVDKPLEWTSFSVVNKIRFLFKYKMKLKLKVGHAGTLDPLASGLLIVCYGRMTKKISSFQDMPKEYTGIIRLGGSTPSYDMETEVDETFPTDHITETLIRETAQSMTGSVDQIPPKYSARKVDGERAYLLARRGEEVEMKKSRVQIDAFEIVSIEGNDVSFRIECSKGTYIRSIAHDFGKKLNSGAHLASLRRTAIGNYRVEDAKNLEKIEEEIKILGTQSEF